MHWTILILLLAAACSSTPLPRETVTVQTPAATVLLPPAPRATLVLFPCFSCDAANTRSESAIPSHAVANDVAVVLMEFNQRVHLESAELEVLLDTLHDVLDRHHLRDTPVVLGGFSSGGNVATLLAKHLVAQPHAGIPVKGLFVVDSPLDLAHLYHVSERHQQHPVEGSAQEARMVVRLLHEQLGHPVDSAARYLACSPISNDARSLDPLLPLAIRLYTEPDTAWWMAERGYSYEELNAARLERLHQQLEALGHARCELILTTGRGVQQGVRHPHAWSIVEEQELVPWVLGL